jgi:hypothetical protein
MTPRMTKYRYLRQRSRRDRAGTPVWTWEGHHIGVIARRQTGDPGRGNYMFALTTDTAFMQNSHYEFGYGVTRDQAVDDAYVRRKLMTPNQTGESGTDEPSE